MFAFFEVKWYVLDRESRVSMNLEMPSFVGLILSRTETLRESVRSSLVFNGEVEEFKSKGSAPTQAWCGKFFGWWRRAV